MALQDAASPTAYAEEYHQFIAKLRAYHEQRGTHFDPEPRVGARAVDLLSLYSTVIDAGGYDKVSDEKLAWRKVGEKFIAGQNNQPALAFQLKTVYYKYLSAYEISTVYGREPPPKEILEDTTAKGGNLLNRTLENWKPSANRTATSLGLNMEGSDASGDDGTPSRERNGSEEAPGSGGRAMRGLRNAPPQRVLFQPDTHSSRQPRHVSATSNTPTPQIQYPVTPRGASSSYNPSSNIEHMSATVTNYEPRPQMPLTLRPVVTPGNAPTEFAKRQRALAAAQANGGQSVATAPKVMLPGTGFDGPNIYVRCLQALKSGIPSEQEYALHHLVKISMERGDKYRFESFTGLAEALIDKLLEISSLFYNVEWDVVYMDAGPHGNETLDGLRGTPDLLKKIANLSKLPADDNIQSEEFSDALLQINEAALTIRNMVMLEENASYVSNMDPLHDFLTIALNLPDVQTVVELKHYALEIAEQITKYYPFYQSDPLYVSLLAQLESEDRGVILTSLRAISRISMNLEENNLLTGVPLRAIENIIIWTLLPDEDLVHACLDFLYQYTAVVENVDFLITNIRLEPLVDQLSRLLSYGARTVEKVQHGWDSKEPAPKYQATVPDELFEELQALPEPERSSQWLKCLFEEDRDEWITQIALWQAYQAQFSSLSAQIGGQTNNLLPAADFIKNVSSTFADKASAQVQQGPVQKFIIKGIRYRAVPIDMHGEDFKQCLWTPSSGLPPCSKWYMSPERMYQHILKDHIRATQQEDGKFLNSDVGDYRCHWNTCRRFHDNPKTTLAQLGQHIKVHLPKPLVDEKITDVFGAPHHVAKKQKLSYIVPGKKRSYKFVETAMDERKDAAGIPLSAVLVLRNLARKIPKTDAEEAALKASGVSWVDKLFKPVEPRYAEILAHNKSLGLYIFDLLKAIKDAQS
ncbi:hypothetical protein B0O99DRAFT_648706 [Bisporella sp. PMI_857]|nr:hypothetical protein B0O99DRAFT_648706 [Bisporella sp. PMI_857]